MNAKTVPGRLSWGLPCLLAFALLLTVLIMSFVRRGRANKAR